MGQITTEIVKGVEPFNGIDTANEVGKVMLECDKEFEELFVVDFQGTNWKHLRELDPDESDDELELDDYPINRASIIRDNNLDLSKVSFTEDTIEEMEDLNEDGKVKKMVIMEGNGGRLPEDSNVLVEYLAYSETDESVPFDSTFTRDRPDRFSLSDGKLLKGFHLGLRSMEVGEVSKFLVQPELAFGETGHEPRVPPGSRIMFVVEMVKILPQNKLNDVLFIPRAERPDLSFDVIRQAAQFAKEEALKKYEEVDYVSAVKLCSVGVSLLEEYPTGNENDTKIRDDLVTRLHLNKAQCFIKLGQPSRACNACKFAVQTNDDVLKAQALLKFAEAKAMLEGFDEAVKYCDKSRALFRKIGRGIPQKCQDLWKLIKEGQAEQKKKEVAMYKRMFNTK